MLRYIEISIQKNDAGIICPKQVLLPGGNGFPVVLMANKCDLDDKYHRQVRKIRWCRRNRCRKILLMKQSIYREPSHFRSIVSKICCSVYPIESYFFDISYRKLNNRRSCFRSIISKSMFSVYRIVPVIENSLFDTPYSRTFDISYGTRFALRPMAYPFLRI